MNNNSPPLTFKRFQTIVSRLELPRRALPTITAQQMDRCRTKIADNHDQLYSIPSLEELGKHRGCCTERSLNYRPRFSPFILKILSGATQHLLYDQF